MSNPVDDITRFESVPRYTLAIAFSSTAPTFTIDRIQQSIPYDLMDSFTVYALDKGGNFFDAVSVMCCVDIARRYIVSDYTSHRVGQSAAITLTMAVAWEATTAHIRQGPFDYPDLGFEAAGIAVCYGVHRACQYIFR